MKRIEIDGSGQCVTPCIFEGLCACHKSAGIIKKNNGFTPNIYVDGEELLCHTATQWDNKGGSNPLDYNDLGRGFVNIKEAKDKERASRDYIYPCD